MRSMTRGMALAAMTLLCHAANAQTQAESPNATPAAAETPAATATPATTPAAGAITVTTGATKLKMGGVVFLQYQYDLTDGNKDKNAFDVTRAYLNVEPSWGDQFYARVTPDVVRQGNATVGTNGNVTSNTTGSLMIRLKYAYLGYKILPNLSLIVGEQKTVFTPWYEDIWGYRVLQDVPENTQFGVTTSDFGWSALATALDGRLEVHSGVFNGEKYTAPEANKYKQLDTRVTFNAMPIGKDQGLKLTGFYSYGLKAQDADKVRAIGLVTFQHPVFSAGGEYLYAQDGDGKGSHVNGNMASLFGFVTLPFVVPQAKDVRVVARVNLVEPNTKLSNDKKTDLIGGLAVRATDKTQFVLDYQSTDFEKPGTPTAQSLFGHWEAKF